VGIRLQSERDKSEVATPRERPASAPSGLDVSSLQRAAGNRATARMLATLRLPPGARALQRTIIPAAGIAGLVGNLDTANLDASKAQIDAMWNGGKRKGLADLYAALGQASATDTHPANNQALRTHIDTYLHKRREDDPLAGDSPFYERWAFDYAHAAADETGITQIPGQAEVLPNPATQLQTAALAVRGWQIGDIADGVSWSTLGRHLQGRMSPKEYFDLGDDILAWRHAHGVAAPAMAAAGMKALLAQQACRRVSQAIGAGLDFLPKCQGESYRAATAARGVYGTTIDVGDLIKDRAFWSTAGLRMGHRNASFGSEGTLDAPKVYYIINGSTGVFLPRYTNKEVGVREILYKNETIFRVRKITNYLDRTFFVWVDEVDPATLAPNPVTKNPWSGAVN